MQQRGVAAGVAVRVAVRQQAGVVGAVGVEVERARVRHQREHVAGGDQRVQLVDRAVELQADVGVVVQVRHGQAGVVRDREAGVGLAAEGQLDARQRAQRA